AVVRVQRAKYEVAGERSLDGHFRRLHIADFTHQDNVGVLTQDAAQPGGEGEANLGPDLDLADPGNLVFDGVFHRDDVLVRGVHALQGGVERGGFARTGGTCDQNDAVGAGDELIHARV